MRDVYVVVPDGIDDPARPSGGNVYDRRICDGLAGTGWLVHELAVAGSWPCPDDEAGASLTAVIAAIPDDAVVLVDGLIASSVPHVLVPEARRVHLVVLVHMPLGTGPVGYGLAGDEVIAAREREVLSVAAAVVTTSTWTRQWLLDRLALPPGQVHVAEPGVESAACAPGTADGGHLLCVAAVTPAKGHDVLLAALATIPDLPWHLLCVGSLERDLGFVAGLTRRAREGGIIDRICFTGPRTGAELDATFAGADVLVLASRAETYGMVVTEALAHGLPVIASAVGGLPQAMGVGADGNRPGLLVPPGDPAALGAALRAWLLDADLRRRLRRAASERRGSLPDWSTTTDRLSRVLSDPRHIAARDHDAPGVPG